MILQPIPPDAIEAAWPVIAPFARQMAARLVDDWPEHETKRQAIDGTLALRVIWSPDERKAYGIAGTQIVTKPSGRRFYYIAMVAGHHRERWLHLIEELEADALRQGCDVIATEGRDWTRDLIGRGYQRRREAMMWKVLNGQP